MSALIHRSGVQGRPLALAVTIGLHVALVSGLLAIKVVKELRVNAIPLQMKNVEDKPRPVPVETPIVPVLGKFAAVPQPPVDLPALADAETIAAQVVDIPPDAAVESARGSGAGSVVIPDTPLRYQAIRSSDDYYPPQAIRMETEGAAVVQACVDASGRLSGTPTVARSSRSSLLDAAAVKWASEALRFQPATRAGAAVAACKEFRVSFKLH
jgi:TonB family protein